MPAEMTNVVDYDGCGRCDLCGGFFPYDEMYNRMGRWECIDCSETDPTRSWADDDDTEEFDDE